MIHGVPSAGCAERPVDMLVAPGTYITNSDRAPVAVGPVSE
jgi:hypothetical protein